MKRHLRVISPATSLSIVDPRIQKVAKETLLNLGWEVSISKHAFAENYGTPDSISQKVQDLHEAISDISVTHVMAAIGGWTSHELLPLIDWTLWKRNPKPIIGYSDITALQNALFAINKVPSIHGPVFSTFGQTSHLSYTIDQFEKCLNQREYPLRQSVEWLDDAWYEMKGERESHPTRGYHVLSSGEASGKIIGGNLSTFMLLAGTKYFPKLAGSILFIEEVASTTPNMFRRWVHQLSQQKGADQIAGFVLGRFPRESSLDHETLSGIFLTAGFLGKVPVIADASFGHTYPVGSFPIGGHAQLVTKDDDAEIVIKTAPV